MRFWPRSFAGQLTLLLLVALLVAQILSVLLFAGEWYRHADEHFDDLVTSRVATLLRALPEVPPPVRDEVVRAASTRLLRFSLGETPLATGAAPRFHDMHPELAEDLGVGPGDIRVAMFHRGLRGHVPAAAEDGDRDAAEDGRRRPRQDFSAVISVRLPDGSGWLNAVTGPPPRPRPFGRAFLVSLALQALLVGAAAAILARRIVRPMRRLAEAAERYGRGERFPPLAEAGPDEARRSARAFNQMRERLDAFVADRTRMLAAISHDLRTPITSLRLRAELVEDEETRDRLVATVQEMQDMAEAALAFARADQAEEETRSVDLAALVESLVEDMAELGHAASFAAAAPVVVRCRPVALRRAVRNVLENAVRYGERARVVVRGEAGRATVEVEDDGPGIPVDEIERMFEPFVRAETSRSRETGGIGLGLAIARTIMRGHGGDIRLANRPAGGLVATLSLPAA